MWLLSDKYKYLFVHVPKNGGNSIWQELLCHEKRAQIKLFEKWLHMRFAAGGDIEHRERILLGTLAALKEDPVYLKSLQYGHATISQIKEFVPDNKFDTYLKIAIVRNPWERAYSLYTYHTKFGKSVQLDFSDYLVEQGEVGALDQFQWLESKGKNVVNEIIRMEDFQSQVPVVMGKLGIQNFKLQHRNVSTSRGDYKKYFTS